jgi:hypothetical protein
MRPEISYLLSATWLLGATAATAQSFPCASVAPEVRERVREAGACRDATPDDVAPQGAASVSSAVTVTLSDGTVVRVPREISANIGDGRKRAATKATAARAKASTQSETDTSGDQVSDGSLASAAGTTPVHAPAAAAAASSMPAPATDSTAASAAGPASAPTATPEPRGRFSIAVSAHAAIMLGAGVLLGLLFGALLMRQWLLRREQVTDESAARPTLRRYQQPVETRAGGVSATGAAPEIRFAARLEPGETAIVLAPPADGDEVAIERSSDHHA